MFHCGSINAVGRRVARSAAALPPRRRRIGRLLLGIVLLCAAVILTADQAAFAEQASRAAWIEFRGVITPLRAAILQRKLERAHRAGAKLVVLEIDSPGGMLGPTIQLAEMIRDLKWARTVAYIPRQALSGAAIVSLACDEIIMAPTGHIGDAGPIVQGDDALFRHAPEKIVSELAQFVRDLAEATGKPAALAEAMVNRNLELHVMHHVQNGSSRVMSRQDLAGRDDAADWREGVFVPESAKDKFLTLNGKRAYALGLAGNVVENDAALWKTLGLDRPPRKIPQSAVDVIVIFLNTPFFTGLLLVIGVVALAIELGAPGIGLGGLISGLCFALFFWSRFLSDTAGWLEVILFVAGIVFLAVEVFVLPGFGIAGLCGIGLLMASIVMASYQGYFPQDRQAFAAAGKMALVFVMSMVGSVVLIAIVATKIRQVPFLKHLVLAPPPAATSTTTEQADRPVAGEGADVGVDVGAEGVADSPLRPAGRARFGDDFYDVMADGVFVEPGTPIRVVRRVANKIIVRPVSEG